MNSSLCGTRFPLQGSPTLCTLDVYILPLPSVLFLLSLPFLSFLSHANRNREPSLFSLTTTSQSLRWWLHYLYAFLVFCILGMRALEIARMAVANMGVGVLPIGLVPPILILVGLLWRDVGRNRGFSISFTIAFYWFFSTIVLIIKCIRLGRLLAVNPATDTDYPTSDYVLDNVVTLGLTLASTVIESKHTVTVFADIREQQRIQKRALNTVGTVMTGVSLSPTLV